MPRKPILRSTFGFYHIYNRVLDKSSYPRDKYVIWRFYLEFLEKTRRRLGWKIYAFVLMDNHYHLLVSTPFENIDDCMEYFQGHLSQRISAYFETQKYRFSGRYRWSYLCDERAYWCVLKYILRNPIKAGMTSKPWEYAYCIWALQQQSFSVDICGLGEPDGLWDWLSAPEKSELNDAIRRGLRRSRFSLGVERSSRRAVKSSFQS